MAQRNLKRRASARPVTRKAQAPARRRVALRGKRVQLPALRNHRADAAGRRRAGRVSGRRLSGASRSRRRAELARRHFDRRVEYGDHRRQSAGKARSNGCCNSGRPSASRRSGCRLPAFIEHALFNSERRGAQGVHGNAGHWRARRRAEGLFRAALPAAVAARCRDRPSGQLLRHRAAQGDAARVCATSTASTHGEMRVSVGAVNVRHGQFCLLRQHADHAEG